MKNIVKSLRFITISAMVVSFSLIWCPLFSQTKAFSASREMYKNLKIFSEVLELVEKNYVEEVDAQEIIQEAISGMIKSLDPHSSYMNADMYKELQVDTKGVFSGLGIVITMQDDIITVVSPIEDKPAYIAGIKSGDKIIKINGKSTQGITLIEAVQQLRGPAGTKVTITVARKGLEKPKDFEITRAIIKVKSVKKRVFSENIGYVRISSFQETTTEELRNILQELKKETKGLRGIILDLRNNPGGLLDQSIHVSDVFLKSGKIVSTKGRAKNTEIIYRAQNDGDEPTCPMIVLINSGSASASEIVSGALQDNKRAILLGTQTFGKASMQVVIPLDDGSALKLTTAKYYTPNGTSIQARGINPDIELEYVAENNDEKKREIREKDLKGHLTREAKDKSLKKESAKMSEEKNELNGDNQLKHAVELIKSWKLFHDMRQG